MPTWSLPVHCERPCGPTQFRLLDLEALWFRRDDLTLLRPGDEASVRHSYGRETKLLTVIKIKGSDHGCTCRTFLSGRLP